VRAAIGMPDVNVAIGGIATEVAERFTEGLIGDAAHIMPLKGGFGGNTGVQDTRNLAWKLTLVLKGVAGPELLATYNTERQPLRAACRSRTRQWRYAAAHRARALGAKEAFEKINAVDWRVVAKLLRLLASPNESEAANAARALGRLDLHTIAAQLEGMSPIGGLLSSRLTTRPADSSNTGTTKHVGREMHANGAGLDHLGRLFEPF
jgi:hypothetical protein